METVYSQCTASRGAHEPDDRELLLAGILAAFSEAKIYSMHSPNCCSPPILLKTEEVAETFKAPSTGDWASSDVLFTLCRQIFLLFISLTGTAVSHIPKPIRAPIHRSRTGGNICHLRHVEDHRDYTSPLISLKHLTDEEFLSARGNCLTSPRAHCTWFR